MLSIFSCPKPFTDSHINTIQRNAIKSWTLLRPKPEIILFGNETGTIEICEEFNLNHISNIMTNQFGTPLVNDLFETAQKIVTNNTLCYINSDIILMYDFVNAIKQVESIEKKFLIVGRRWDVCIDELLSFEDDWQENLQNHALKSGKLHSLTGIDYFVFPRGLWNYIPPFALGRTIWDNWLLYYALSQKAALIDASNIIMAIHQNHTYNHHPEGKWGIWNGIEAKYNENLAGGRSHVFTIEDANYIMTKQGLRRALFEDSKRIGRYLNTIPIFYPYLRFPTYILIKLLYIIRFIKREFRN